MKTERTAEEWGRVAVALPGWRESRGMTDTWGRTAIDDAAGGIRWANPFNPADNAEPDHYPDPDDPATAGCLLALLIPSPTLGHVTQVLPPMSVSSGMWRVMVDTQWGRHTAQAPTFGRACIAAAESLGRWPGGAS